MRTGEAMKLSIDPDKCVSAGQCVLSAPDVFDQGEDDGVVILLIENPSQERADAVREAASLCPARAIHLA
jgi:ferredoxin